MRASRTPANAPDRPTGPDAARDLGLDELPLGIPARIVAVPGTPGPAATGERALAGQAASHAGRLADLGFVAGAAIELIRRAPLGDPAVYRVRGYEICLRRAQARGIRVACE